MNEKSSSSAKAPADSISAGKAVVIGHLVVTVAAMILMYAFAVVGRLFFPKYWVWIFLLGVALVWLYCSLAILFWRRWAMHRVADTERFQKLAVATFLIAPKGSFLEKLEFKVDKK